MCTFPKRKIICIIQDPDNKTVFGYVCCPPYPFRNPCKLYAFESEEVSDTKEALC